MFNYSDEEFLENLEKIEKCESMNDLKDILNNALKLQGYIVQIVRSHKMTEFKNYVALSNGMPQVLTDYLNKHFSVNVGPIGKLVINSGRPIWFSDVIREPSLVSSEHSKTHQKLLDLTGDGIFIPTYFKNHWAVTLVTFGKAKPECSDLLRWKTGTLFHQIHIRYRQLRETFQQKVKLTNRETDVLVLLTLGKTNSEIGIILDIKTSTVSTYVKNIYMKLGVSNRVSASLEAMYLDLKH